MRVVKRRVFPEAFKREAVDRVVSSGLSAGAVATSAVSDGAVTSATVGVGSWGCRLNISADVERRLVEKQAPLPTLNSSHQHSPVPRALGSPT